MAAFDWSPGGCCCEVGGMYDLFNYGGDSDVVVTGINGNKFVRIGSTMLPVGASTTYLNTFPNWFVEPLRPVRSEIGVTSNGKLVWATVVPRPGTGATFIGAYDLVAMQEVTHFNAIDMHAINDTQFANMGTGLSPFQVQDRKIFDRDGTVTTWPAVSPRKTIGTNANPSWTEIEDVVLLASLSWPWAAVLKYKLGGLVTENYYSVEFSHAQLTLEQSGGGNHFALLNKSVIKNIDYNPATPSHTNGVWQAYDRLGTHWAASIFFADYPTFGDRTSQLIIDGTVVSSVPNTTAQPGLDSTLNGGCILHCCYPHESLGDGYCAAIISSEMRVYKGGAEIWRTNTGGRVSQLLGSTDRWIYFKAVGANIVQATNGQFAGTSSTGLGATADAWIARHDGSQIIPQGQLTDTFKVIQGHHNYAPNQHTMARDSTVVPNTLPATYQEMYDKRAGG